MFDVGQEVIWLKTNEKVNIEEKNVDDSGNWYFILAPDEKVYDALESELKSID